MDRRKFLTSSAILSTSAILGQELELPTYQPSASNAKVPIKVLATNWGFPGNHDQFCAKAKADGYDGFEAWVPFDERERDEFVKTAQKYGLEIGFLAGSGSMDYNEHFDIYAKGVELAAQYRPLYVNTHAGRDYFTVEQNVKILQHGIDVAKRTGVSVLCETHRGRCAYSATTTAQYMEVLPELRLTADLSHWCVVHESLLEGFERTVDAALARTGHIHARVGHSEGPQVNDPRAPEWRDAVKKHFGWWDIVMQHAEARKAPFQTFLTEFGPPHYLPALPYTQVPVADQWGVNVHMMKLLRERYA
jgi:sugar phosphate isomerase/epimerase